MRTIHRVAVLGAGTMGSRIAAHFANAGIPALLLDLVLPDQPDRDAAALKGIQTAAAQKPGAFFAQTTSALVTPGNLEDDLGALRDCDWIIEAVTENLPIKRALFEQVAHSRKPGSIVSTNTSGIPLARIAEGFPLEFRRNFLGTHFFNPPRYLYLLETIPGPDTSSQVLDFVSEFSDRRLGKGIVRCKDTPNFIANRIGVFFGATVQKLMLEGDYTIEEVDALTGPLIGLPRSASFRLVDLIGLDTWRHIAVNLYDLVPGDPWRERFPPPDFLTRMVERGWLGEKVGQGFYKRTGPAKELWALDWKTLEYHPAEKALLPEIDAVRSIDSLPERLRALIAGRGRAGSFLWRLFSDVLLYAAGRIPEISNRVVEVDRAMRWGYAHTLGPFELWDALGVEAAAARMADEGRAIPPSVDRMLASGAMSFYRAVDAEGQPGTEYFDVCAGRYTALEPRPGVLILSEIKRARGVLKENPGASLVDLGDGVLCVELHGLCGEDQTEMIRAALEQAALALVIAGQGDNFSAGSDLTSVLLAARDGKWDQLDAALRRTQQMNMAIKYAPRPVVAAPFGVTLGGGCEMVLHAARIQASAELYMGLTEAAAGLIPAGGGCKEMLLRLPDARSALERIALARVSASAEDARLAGLLRPADAVSMNPQRLLADAKAAALSLAAGYAPATPLTAISVSGEPLDPAPSGCDPHVVGKLAYVLSGGRLSAPRQVSEQYLMDLEREAFLSLCGEEKTQARIEHLLKTGKPLRN